jgi:2-dehydro-3-deoxyphosphogluconate aldolase/(4S)-4-hydroxy-2-oxoglutarate aldolase
VIERDETVHRTPASRILTEGGVIAVLRAGHAREYAPVIEAIAEGGVRSIELTLSTNGVFDELDGLRSRFGEAVEIGIGTVTTPEQARTAVGAGAAYVVTPVTDPEVVSLVAAAGVPVFPGGLTPTELLTGWSLGATAVKVFPASIVGASYVAHLRGPFPGIEVVPSGGVGLDDIPAWIAAGALAVSLGGPLVGDAFAGGDLGALTARARRAVDAVAEARAER